MDFTKKFNSLHWHDSSLLSLSVIHVKKSDSKEIKMVVQWPDESVNSVIFEDVYCFDAEMIFGAYGYPTILDAGCCSESPKIDQLKKVMNVWSTVVEFRHYYFKANGSKNDIEICSRSFRIE